MSYPGAKGDVSRVILVRRGADAVKAGGESNCYVSEEDSCSSEMSSLSDDWTTGNVRRVPCVIYANHVCQFHKKSARSFVAAETRFSIVIFITYKLGISMLSH